jgi:hypothetical protein
MCGFQHRPESGRQGSRGALRWVSAHKVARIASEGLVTWVVSWPSQPSATHQRLAGGLCRSLLDGHGPTCFRKAAGTALETTKIPCRGLCCPTELACSASGGIATIPVDTTRLLLSGPSSPSMPPEARQGAPGVVLSVSWQPTNKKLLPGSGGRLRPSKKL